MADEVITTDNQNEVHLLEWQTKVWDSGKRFKVINCGRRTGKSTLSALKMLDFSHQEENAIVWYIAPTYKQAKNIMWEMLRNYVPRGSVMGQNEQELKVTLKNGSTIHLKGADNPDSLRGVRIDLAIFDEVAFLDKWATVWSIMRPTLMDSRAECWFISTPNGFNHFYDLSSKSKTEPDWAYFHFTTYDNPHIPVPEIEQTKKELTEDMFAQEMMGDFRRMEGLVYKPFDRDRHIQVLEDFKPVFWIRGLDRGFTNPTAVVYIQVDADGTWYQTHEIFRPGLTNRMLSEELFAMDEKLGVEEYELSTMDSAQAGDIAELQDYGHDFIPVRKESGETNLEFVRYKIQKFTQKLLRKGNGRFGYYIHPRCINTIREFQSYRYPENVARLNEIENPLKVDDHSMDALGDLNAMYQHYYKPKAEPKPYEGMSEWAYVPVSSKEDDESTDWTAVGSEDNLTQNPLI